MKTSVVVGLAATALAVAAVVIVSTNREASRIEHGPGSEPLNAPWYGLTDNLQSNTGGWLGGLVFENTTDSAISIEGVWILNPRGAIRFGPVLRGRGTPDPVIWPTIDSDRLTTSPLAQDNVFEASSTFLENSIIIRFDLDPTAPAATISGFRVDYSHAGKSYALYVDAYNCVASDVSFDAACSEPIPDPLPLSDVLDLPRQLISE